MVSTNEMVVIRITWDHVVVAIADESKPITWSELRRAAKQDDRELRCAYAAVLAEAEQMAREKRAAKVVVRNMTGDDCDTAALTWVATAHYMSGEMVNARLIGADWGMSGSRSQALADAAEAKQRLAEMGYEVR